MRTWFSIRLPLFLLPGLHLRLNCDKFDCMNNLMNRSVNGAGIGGIR